MRPLKSLYASITYYRKHNLILFAFFTLALFALVALELLSATQQLKFDFISERWQLLTPRIANNQEVLQTLTKGNQALQADYLRWHNILVTAISLGLIGLTGILLWLRRQSIKALLSLGVSRLALIGQLVIEALFPVIFSFLLLLCLSLIFQTSFKSQLVRANNQLYLTEISEKKPMLKLYETKATGAGDKERTAHEPLILPFSNVAFYQLDDLGPSINFRTIRQSLARVFLTFIVLALSLITLMTSLLVLYFSLRIHY